MNDLNFFRKRVRSTALRRNDRELPTPPTKVGIPNTCLVVAIVFLLLPSLSALADSKPEGCHVGEITDQDGDLQIQMESEWISMHLMPANQSEIVRFVFRPSGNDIEVETNPKYAEAGGGLLQDNFWEQDW